MKKIIKTIMMAVACGGLFPAAATAQSYQLVTADNQLESGKRYLIVAKHQTSNSTDYYAWNGLDTNSGNAIPISTPSEINFTPTETVVPVQLVLKEGETNKWKIIDTATNNYVGVSSTNNSNLVGGSIASNDYYSWRISIDEIDKIATVENISSSSRYLKFYSSYGSNNFSPFAQSDASGVTPIALYKETGSSLILYNGRDNTTAIGNAANSTCDVILENRMLYRDGKWNTLCLPFGVSAEQIAVSTHPLYNTTIMELDTDGTYKEVNNAWTNVADGTQKTGLTTDGTLYLFFKTATSIKAGRPYIIKWEGSSGIIDSPIFSNVTISKASTTVEAKNSGLNTVQFIGTYGPVGFTANDKSKLFLGGSNSLYYPNAAMNVNAFRAYFNVDLQGSANSVRSFVLNFGENEATGIVDAEASPSPFTHHPSPSDWYDLQGRRVASAEANSSLFTNHSSLKKGLYINNGRKVAIK